MKNSKKYQVKSRMWITTSDGTFLGEGRIYLLEEIEKHGSISRAAKEMKMSYKKAWELVNSMNKQGPEVLVTPKIGGKGGGGSVLSEAGRRAIMLYTKLNEENRKYLETKIKELDF